jgi:hypothetical protein
MMREIHILKTFKDDGVGSRRNIFNHRRKKIRLLGKVSQKQNKLNKTQYISAYKAILRSTMMIVLLY